MNFVNDFDSDSSFIRKQEVGLLQRVLIAFQFFEPLVDESELPTVKRMIKVLKLELSIRKICRLLALEYLRNGKRVVGVNK